MITYLILRNPGHNRVYYNQSEKLALAELKITTQAFEQKSNHVEVMKLAGLSYLSFKVPSKLNAGDLGLVADLSFLFALFEYQIERPSKEGVLIPVPINTKEHLNSKVSTLLKYSGKTNELFTRMMINVALLSSSFDAEDQIQMLDPVAGKGTTLFEGAIKGFDVTGIEINHNFVHETTIFFRKFLEREKYKHTVTKNPMYKEKGCKESYIQQFEYAPSKAEFKDTSGRKHLDLIAGTTLHSKHYFRNEKFHMIIGDLPYGITHGHVTNQKYVTKTRSSSDLLLKSLPDWYKILKRGGVMVLSWNTLVLSRSDFLKEFKRSGFEILTSSPYDNFSHQVDQSIRRDIIVARKVF